MLYIAYLAIYLDQVLVKKVEEKLSLVKVLNVGIGQKALDDGGPNSSHNVAARTGEDLLKQSQSILSVLIRQSDKAKSEYQTRLQASITTNKVLLRQGVSFRGHDESEFSENRGNFLEFLEVIANENPDVRSVVLENAPKNHQLTSLKIQKDIVRAIASLTTKEIIKDFGDAFFFAYWWMNLMMYQPKSRWLLLYVMWIKKVVL
ncbi:unnamed protein product [Linum tenue]|uniref:DUF4371 domain-containing protein n=1 Tax=Linum tenue TaxID=586396 RepID=A0AAV0HXP9_9ROSI|nr:unnamed protein product [Linum tenue]